MWNFGILRSYFGKVSSFFRKLSTKSMIGGSTRSTLENLEFGNPKIICWEGVMFFYELFTKSVIWVSKRLKWKNMEIWNLGILTSYFGEVSFGKVNFARPRKKAKMQLIVFCFLLLFIFRKNTLRPPVWFLVPNGAPSWRLKSLKMEAGKASFKFWDPKVAPR